MKKTVKSNLALSVAILVMGISGLMLMVWLSPAPDEAPSGQLNTRATPEQAPSMADHSLGSKPMAADPFAEKLGAPPDAVDASKGSETARALRESSIPIGVDPFKEKLLEQSKQATSSPFGQPLTKP